MSRRQSQPGGLSLGVIVGALGTILFCCGAPALVIWQALSRGGKQDTPAIAGGADAPRSNPNLPGRKPVKPQGSRLTEHGVVAGPEIVDELWPKLLGKWQALPNPELQATVEFYADYSYAHWSIMNGHEEKGSSILASIQDRSVLGPVWKVARPGDRHYLFVYETPKDVSLSGTVTYLKSGILDLGGRLYWRTSNGNEKLPSLEDTIWLQLAGSRWGSPVAATRQITEFRINKTAAIQDVSDRGALTTTLEGRVGGIRVTPTGFFVNIQVAGQQPGELGEFSFTPRDLRRKDPRTGQTSVYERKEIGSN